MVGHAKYYYKARVKQLMMIRKFDSDDGDDEQVAVIKMLRKKAN